MSDIFKHRPLSGYTIIANKHIQNRALSGLARAVLCYFLSLPDTWEIRVANIQQEFGVGRDQMRKAFRELEAVGHMRLAPSFRKPDGSPSGSRWKVYAEPSENPDYQLPTGFQSTENQPPLRKDLLKKVNKKTLPIGKESSVPPMDSPSAGNFDSLDTLPESGPNVPRKGISTSYENSHTNSTTYNDLREWVEEECPKVAKNRPELIDELEANGFKDAKGKPVRDVRKFVLGLEEKMPC